MANKGAKRKIAWGITGSGDRITETVEKMIELQKQYDDVVDVRVFVSKAGEQVIKYYKLFNTLEKHFDKVWVEINSNSPFLAGQLQPAVLAEAARQKDWPLTLRIQPGYDHSYYFIASFIEDHLRFHAEHLFG